MIRSLLRWILVLAVILGGLYWWFAWDGAMPPTAKYTLDMAEVRKAADAVPGDKPGGIRFEHVASFRFPGAMIVSGDGWAVRPLRAHEFRFDAHFARLSEVRASIVRAGLSLEALWGSSGTSLELTAEQHPDAYVHVVARRLVPRLDLTEGADRTISSS